MACPSPSTTKRDTVGVAVRARSAYAYDAAGFAAATPRGQVWVVHLSSACVGTSLAHPTLIRTTPAATGGKDSARGCGWFLPERVRHRSE